MSKSERCLLITDNNNLPQKDTFSGKIHGLTNVEADVLGDTLHYDLIFSTPEEAFELLNGVSVLFDRTLNYSNQVVEIHKKCSELGISYLNYPSTMEIFANKLQTYQVLKSFGIQQPYTEPISSEVDLGNFVRRTGIGNRFVVKPTWGGLGNWVTFIDIMDVEQIRAFWKSDSQIENFSGKPRDFFHQVLSTQEGNTRGNSRITEKPMEWIAQEYLDMIRPNGLATDIRVMEQRDGSGNMKVSQMHGRQSSSLDLPLTNLSKGGNICDICDTLEGTDITSDQLLNFCRKVDSVVELLTGRFIGEVGHDIAVVRKSDHFGLFYIEGNTMPGYILESWDIIKNKTVTNDALSLLTPADHSLLTRPLEYINNIIDLRAVALIKP